MPAFEVRRTKPFMVSVTVEAANEMAALRDAQRLFMSEAFDMDAYEVLRQPQRPDDDGDARSEARYEQTATDDASEQTERERWGLGGAESPREGTEA